MRNPPEYTLGQALVLLDNSPAGSKLAADAPELSYSLRGRFYASSSGWLLLSVPNALARGAFDALNEPGVELPPDFNAHISVIRPEELSEKGLNPDKITERGHDFGYTLGPVRTVSPHGWDEISKVWFIEVNSPDLEKLRKSYGLTPLPNDNEFKFHITFATRKKNVILDRPYAAKSLMHNPPARKAAVANVVYSEWKDDTEPDVLDRSDAHVKGKNVGYLTSHPETSDPTNTIWLQGMRVSPKHRGQGIATELLSRVLAKHPDKNFELRAKPYSDKPLDQQQLQDFYSRWGFKPNDDKGRMRRELPQAKAAEEDVSSTLDQLRSAKDESDRKNYHKKHHILRELIAQSPHDWWMDSAGHHPGVTHRPTGFRFHLSAAAIPVRAKMN